jgi:hypothetical protein
MSLRLTGSDDSSRDVAAIQCQAQMTHSIQAGWAREQNGSAIHEQGPQVGSGSLPENVIAINGGSIDRPSFARFHASVAERQLDWGWQQCPDAAGPSHESQRNEPGHAGTGFSARALWLGGIAFAVLAVGILATVATVQSSRTLPFEAWARGDLMQRAGGMPGAMPRDAMVPGQSAGAPQRALMGRAGHDPIAALAGPVAARPEPAATPASADREPGQDLAALAPDAKPDPSDLEIAILGPILASAATAEQLAANLPLAPRAGVGTRAERLLNEPPRPVFKPTLVSSSQQEPNEAARPLSRP